ncbi:hypothetical protein LCGC14_0442420 [marine sediment metagenome]|uniref:Uncharacterized protein n=1 Tax=marine sediment metagenome TaxID=412755 RepID=A0A0F9T320_9ZZZZ
MPATQKVRRLMCAVCNDKVKAKPGQKLPDKAVACEQCTAKIKKSLREEMERETPTKRFLVKFASHLTTQLPTAIVQDAMKKARGHAGGTGKITKKPVVIEKAAGVLSKDLVNYQDKATDEQMRSGRICTSCSFFDLEGNTGVCQLVEGDIEQFGTCDLFKPGEYIIVKAQPDSGDVHVDSLLSDKDDDGVALSICKFKSPDEDEGFD